MELKKARIDYKWVILLLCFLMEFICLGFCSSNTGLYTKAVTEALDIKRSIYSLSSSIRFAVQVFVAFNLGALVGRFGFRRLVCVGMLSLTGSVVVRACATQVFHIYISSVLWGMGIVLSGGTMAGMIVRRWFRQDIGRYTGIVMSANGIGGAVAAQIISPLINNGEVFGYRKAYFLSAAISLAISIVILIFLRERPADAVMTADVDVKKKPKGDLWEGMPYETVKKKPYFYVTAAMVLVTGISLQSVGNVTLVHMADIGINAGFVATTATVSSLCLAFSKVFVGATYDKRGLRTVFLICQVAAIASFILFAALTNSTAGMVMAIVATVLQTLASPMETVLITLMSGDLFGSASYHKVLGVFMAMNSLGLCIGSPIGDLCHDILGTYTSCFWFFAGLLTAVAIGYRFVIRAAYRDRKAMTV